MLERILEACRRDREIQVLIKWKGMDECESSWEPLKKFHGQFRDFHLEDKVVADKGRNDTIPLRTYVRRYHTLNKDFGTENLPHMHSMW